MRDRFNFRIPMFSDKGNFLEFQYLQLGEQEETTLCGYNGEPQQCTGLRDRNGKLIYEGDIVRVKYYNPTRYNTFSIGYREAQGSFVYQDLSDPSLYAYIESAPTVAERYQVIGNVYESGKIMEEN